MSEYQPRPPEVPKHPVIYVTDTGQAIDKLVKRVTPNRLKASCPKGSKFVIRLGPMTKQWEVYDLRCYVLNPTPSEFYWAPPACAVLPDRERAVMWAVLS